MAKHIIQEDGEELPETGLGHGNEALGPSDNSDSGSDTPAFLKHGDSDSQGTGDRASANRRDDEDPARDVEADSVVGEKRAGLSHSRPNPVRNGG